MAKKKQSFLDTASDWDQLRNVPEEHWVTDAFYSHWQKGGEVSKKFISLVYDYMHKYGFSNTGAAERRESEEFQHRAKFIGDMDNYAAWLWMRAAEKEALLSEKHESLVDIYRQAANEAAESVEGVNNDVIEVVSSEAPRFAGLFIQDLG